MNLANEYTGIELKKIVQNVLELSTGTNQISAKKAKKTDFFAKVIQKGLRLKKHGL